MSGLLTALGLLTLLGAGPWRVALPDNGIDGLTVSRDGQYLAARLGGGETASHAIVVIDLERGLPVARVGPPVGPVSLPVWLPGNRLAAADDEGICVWDDAGRAPAIRYPLPLHRPWPGCAVLAASADGHRLAVSAPTEVLVLDARTGAVQRRLPVPADRPFPLLLLDDDGSHLYTGTRQGLTRWEIASLAQVRQLPGPVADLSWTRDGRLLTAGRGVTIHDPETLAPVRTWSGFCADTAWDTGAGLLALMTAPDGIEKPDGSPYSDRRLLWLTDEGAELALDEETWSVAVIGPRRIAIDLDFTAVRLVELTGPRAGDPE